MSSRDVPPQGDTPPPDGQTNSDGRGTSNVIEFIDNQDPNVRSAIQRHTAYYSAAQRRETRSRLLRRSSQAHYLEWSRRPRTDPEVAVSSASSLSSVSISPAPSMPERSEQHTRASSVEREAGDQAAAETAGDPTFPLSRATTSSDNAVLDSFVSTFCDHYHSRDMIASSMAFMQETDTTRYLLLAYAYAMRRTQPAAGGNPQDQVDAQTNLGRGTNILWNRLQMPGQASSDTNIQAVLLLVAYTADFGQPDDVSLHTNALRTMIDQRGGVEAFTHNPVLHHQLLAVEASRRYHLTLDCTSDCPELHRFPDGLQLRQADRAG